MAADLSGKKVLIIGQNWGIEQVELMQPYESLKADGAEVVLAAGTTDPIECFTDDRYPGKTIQPDAAYKDLSADDFDALVVPGGTCNVDRLRIDEDACNLARDFAAKGKLIASICHAPWLLINAGLVEGRQITSCPFIVQDVKNAGGKYEDKEVIVEEKDGWKLISSRLPCDLDPFVGAIEEALA